MEIHMAGNTEHMCILFVNMNKLLSKSKSKSKKSKKTLFKVGTVKNNKTVALICNKW